MADGLLDFIKTPEGQGLLSTVFGGLAGARRNAPLNSIGQAGMAGLMGYGSGLERQAQMAEMDQMKQLREYQIQQARQAALDQQSASEFMKNWRNQSSAQPVAALPAPVQSVAFTPEYNAQRASVAPAPMPAAPAASAAPSYGSKAMIAAMIQSGNPLLMKQAESMVNAAKLTEDEYGTEPRLVTDQATGQRKYVLISKQGNVKPIDNYGVAPKINMQNLGNRVVAIDENSAQNGQDWKMGQSPDSVASNAVAWANNRNSVDRLNFDKSQANQPVFHDGNWVTKPTFQHPNGTAVQVPGIVKPLTEAQAKANLFGTRAQEAHKTMGELAKGDGADRPGLIKRVAEGTAGILPSWAGGEGLTSLAGAATNWTQSSDQQQVEQAQRDFVNAILRRESGAVISPSEFTSAQKQYFPQVGDSEAVLAQKTKNRQTAINGLQAEVPGGFRVGGSPNGGMSSNGKKSAIGSGWSASEVR